NGPIELTATTLPTVWQALFEQAPIILKHHLAAAASQAISGPNALVVSFPAGYNPPSEAHRGQLEELLESITGSRPSVKFEYSAARAVTQTVPTESVSQRRRRQQETVLKEPLLKKAVEVLGAQLVSMDEGFGESRSAAPAPKQADFG